MPNTTSGKHTVLPPSADYMKWIKRFPLRPIQTDAENEAALEVLSELADQSVRKKLTKDEEAYMDVLSDLVGSYESAQWTYSKAKPAEVLEFLMEQHGLKQADLVAEMGTQSAVSMVLTGQRELSKRQIELLSKRFNVNPGVFFAKSE